jgi:hypothetical protein
MAVHMRLKELHEREFELSASCFDRFAARKISPVVMNGPTAQLSLA